MNLKFYPILQVFTLAFLLFGFSGCFSSSQEERRNTRNENTLSHDEDEKHERTAPAERWKAEFDMIKDPITGQIPAGIRQKEMKAALKTDTYQLPYNEETKTLPSINIIEKGPNNYGGRTRALEFDMRNSSIVLSGGVTGGIFRSTNGGDSWTRVTPAGALHSLASLVQDPRVGHQDTWYAGTGESNSSAGDASASGTYLDGYHGHGIYKSTDNGSTWAAMANTQGSSQEIFDERYDYVHRMVINPDNGNIIAAVANVISHLDISTNTWTQRIGSFTANRPSDVLYNAVGDKFYAAINGLESSANAGIYSSLDGLTWTKIATTATLNPNGAASFGHDVERIILANVADTDDILAFYNLYEGGGVSCGGQTSDAGLAHLDGTTNTWTLHSLNIGNCAGGTTSPKVINSQQGYNLALTTKPNDANWVYLGGVEAYRYNLSTNVYEFIGGSQDAANAINLHVDQHIFKFEPGSNDIMWAGNDGGLRKTDVTGALTGNGYVWSDRNTNYVTYQYYGADINSTTGSTFVGGGAQDNAFSIQPTTAQALEVGPTADGTALAIISGTSFTDHNLLCLFQNGGLARVVNGTISGYVEPSGKTQNFVAKMHSDIDNREILYYPTKSPNGLLRTRIASTISSGTITGNASTGWEQMTGLSINGTITAMQASHNNTATGFVSGEYTASDSNRKLYFGTERGNLYRLDDPAFGAAGTAPVEIGPSVSPNTFSTKYLSDIAVNPNDDKEVVVTYSNYSFSSVWHTSDASVASPVWTEIEGPSGSAVELASIRSALMVDAAGTLVYLVGTSTGLYATDALSGATTSWTRLGTVNDLGLAVSVDMRLRTADNKVIVGTHGNGLFLLEFPSVLPVELTSFTGEGTSKGNLLTWTTAAEQNNAGFEIEKSTDSQTFVKIGFEEGNQTTSESHTYTFLDNPVTDETTYYRLKQLDNDGQFEYSEVISIRNTQASDVSLTLYPNPVRNNLTVENGEGKVTIHSYAGRLLMETQVTDKTQNVDVSGLPTGMYILTVEKANGQIVSRQFVK